MIIFKIRKAFFLFFIALFFSYSGQAQQPISASQELVNTYISQLNEHIVFLNWLTERVYAVNQELVNYEANHQDELLVRNGRYIDLRRASLKKADFNRLHILADSLGFIAPLNSQFIAESKQLKGHGMLLHFYIDTGGYKENTEKGYQLIQEYHQVLHTTYLLREKLLKALHPEVLGDFSIRNPWVKTGNAMLPLLNQAETLLPSFHQRNKVARLDSSGLSALKKELDGFWNDKEKNLAGLLRLTPNRSNNPDHAYKWMKLNTNRFIANYEDAGYYHPRDKHGFNAMVDTYNGLVDMALGKRFNAKTHPRYFEGLADSLRPVFLPYYLKGIAHLPFEQNNSSDGLNDPDPASLEGYRFNNLVFLLDVSGSMAQAGKLRTVKQAMIELVEIMRTDDEITIVTYAGEAREMLKPTSAKKQNRIKKKLRKLEATGSTDLYEGMKLAFSVAKRNYKASGNNRIILVTDGAVSTSKRLQDIAANYAEQSIYLSLLTFENEEHTSLLKLSKQPGAYLRKIDKENIISSLLNEAKRGGLQ